MLGNTVENRNTVAETAAVTKAKAALAQAEKDLAAAKAALAEAEKVVAESKAQLDKDVKRILEQAKAAEKLVAEVAAEVKTQLAQKEALLQQAGLKDKQGIPAKLQEIVEKINAAAKKDADVKEKLAKAQETVKGLEEANAQFQPNDAVNNNHGNNKEGLQQELEAAKAELAQVQKEADAAAQEYQTVKAESDKLTETLAQIDTAISEYESANRDLQRHQAELKKLEQEETTFKEAHAKLEEARKTKQSEYDTALQKQLQAKKDLAAATADNGSATPKPQPTPQPAPAPMPQPAPMPPAHQPGSETTQPNTQPQKLILHHRQTILIRQLSTPQITVQLQLPRHSCTANHGILLKIVLSSQRLAAHLGSSGLPHLLLSQVDSCCAANGKTNCEN